MPEVSQVYRRIVEWCPPATSKNARIEIPSESTMAGTATRCALSLIQCPKIPRIKKEANGSNGMSSYVISPFQQLKFVDVDRVFRPMEGDDDGKADRHLGRGDREREEYEDLAGDVVKRL